MQPDWRLWLRYATLLFIMSAMSRKRFGDANCSAARALEQIGDWWSLLIVREAYYGTVNFSSFQERLGIAKNILTDRLNRLVEHGVLDRQRPKLDVERYTYALTEKGRDLLPILVALMQWGDRWIVGEGQEPVRLLERATKGPIGRVGVTSEDGRALSFEGLAFAPGPGADRRTIDLFRRSRKSMT